MKNSCSKNSFLSLFSSFFILTNCFFVLTGVPSTTGIQLQQTSRKGSKAAVAADASQPQLNLGLILPHSIYNEREYNKAVAQTLTEIQKTKKVSFKFLQKFEFGHQQVHRIMMKVIPSPTEILDNLCETFLEKNVTTILYLTNSELFGRSTASSQYFLQLASYLGIPVIAWNADNSGLERRSQTRLQLQLAPSLEHQVAAMLSILVRYNWQQFSIVTSEIAGHDDFVQAVRDKVAIMKFKQKFNLRIQVEVKVTKREDMRELELSETRILLLYSTRQEGSNIMRWAKEAGLTGKSYVWIATQSVIGESKEALPDFPAGMLGVSFDTSLQDLISQIPVAMQVFANGVEAYINDPENENNTRSLVPQLSCAGDSDQDPGTESKWTLGETFHKYLRNVTVEGGFGKPDIAFSSDGTLKSVELKIMNLRPGISSNLVWEVIGVWQSYQEENNGLDIKDIVWPGHSHMPPQGVPEKFHLTVGFLEEPPFINLAPPDPITGKCNVDRGVPCRMPKPADKSMQEMIVLGSLSNITSSSPYHYQCCSGFCIDLLAKFANDLQFEYDLIRADDPRWGVFRNGHWNGLISELVNKKFDMVLTSLKVNAEREAAVDFTAPFLESGTAILVAKRTGIISPTAFLEPFDAASWLLVGLAAVQISAFSIFLFEWLSPAGYDMKSSPSPDHKFSLFRTYWLVWALLFQVPVNTDCPRSFTARFMASVWALFAVVFLAIYTASLAAFMITREEWDDFIGIQDTRLANPLSVKPPLRYGTVPSTYTEDAIRKHFPIMYDYMKPFNRTNVIDGITAVKKGELNAFIYDATVLDYMVGQDEECKLLTVGSWYAMTGYAAAFPRNSKHFSNFNRKIMDYSENGDLERLRRFWLTGTCNPKKEEKKASEPLAPEQFISAFLLLICGILLTIGLMGLERAYMKWIRNSVGKKDHAGCCALISLSMGKSLTFRGTVYEASEMIKTHRCKDPICDTHLWKVKHELDMARLKLRSLEEELNVKGVAIPKAGLSEENDQIKTNGNGRPNNCGRHNFLNSDGSTVETLDDKVAVVKAVPVRRKGSSPIFTVATIYHESRTSCQPPESNPDHDLHRDSIRPSGLSSSPHTSASIKATAPSGLESTSSSSSGMSPPTSRRCRPTTTTTSLSTQNKSDFQSGRQNMTEHQTGRQNIADMPISRQNMSDHHMGRQNVADHQIVRQNVGEIVRQNVGEIGRHNPMRMIEEHPSDCERWGKPPRQHRRRPNTLNTEISEIETVL